MHTDNLQLENIIYTSEDGKILIEEWKDIKEFGNKYKVSNLGRVKSLRFKSTIRELILKAQLDNKGYYYIMLRDGKISKVFHIHRLVALYFIGTPEKGYVVDHINNISNDNRLSNLQIITTRENRSKDSFNKTGLTGVTFKPKQNKYNAVIRIGKKAYSLKMYNTAQDESMAYQRALYNWENFQILPDIKEYTSKYKGVFLDKKYKLYIVNIMINSTAYYLGRYDSEEIAKEVYNKAKENYHLYNILPDENYTNPNNSSKYKYIQYYKPYNKWLSKFKDIDNKIKHIGYFETEEEAFQAQQQKIKNAK